MRRLFSVAVLAALLAACGPTSSSNPAPPSGLASANVKYSQTGSKDATVQTSSVTLQLDGAGYLSIHLTIKSNVATSETFSVTAKLLDPAGKALTTATGQAITLGKGGSADLYLLGAAASAPAAAAEFDVGAVPASSPSPGPT